MRRPRADDASAFVVADVMDDEIAAEVFAELGAGDHVRATEVVAHDLGAMVAAGLYDDLQGSSSWARAITTTWVAPALAIISASR
jgi:hypothetical protein